MNVSFAQMELQLKHDAAAQIEAPVPHDRTVVGSNPAVSYDKCSKHNPDLMVTNTKSVHTTE